MADIIKNIFCVVTYCALIGLIQTESDKTGDVSIKTKNDTNQFNYYKVIIIGGGASGIAAATRLISKGFDDFIILEAENRMGGRVNTVPYENTTIDMGAQWVHGQKGNVVYEMANKYNMLDDTQYGLLAQSMFVLSDKREFDRQQVAVALGNIMSYLEEEEGLTHYNGSLGHYVLERIQNDTNANKITNDTKLIGEILGFYEQAQNSLDGSDTWFDTSAKTYSQYDELEGSQTNSWKVGGYSNVFKLLLKEINEGETPINITNKLILNKEVSYIEWGDPDHIGVICNDGEVFVADRVLMTVSLGVLKSQKNDLFKPALPDWKQNAIDGLFIGTVDKIFIKFPHKWWNFTEHITCGYSFLWSKEDEDNLFKDIKGPNNKPWIVGIMGMYLTTHDHFTFLGWITGATAKYMETLSDEQIYNDVTRLLKHFINETIPEPSKIITSKWGTNKHFKGSYSCRTLKTDEMNTSATELSKSINNIHNKPVLLFAGEATNERHYSTVHGAVETGWREAEKILQIYNKTTS